MHKNFPLTVGRGDFLFSEFALNSQVYMFTYAAEIAVNVQIANPQHRQMHGFQFFRADRIFFRLCYGIVPATITKDVRGIIKTYVEEDSSIDTSEEMSMEERIANLTLLMQKAAQELEFEEAARLRDEITRIRKQNER